MASGGAGGKLWDDGRLRGLKVLLVDDNRDAAISLSRLLQGFGCETEVCFDGASALATAEALAPQVAILDIRLPDIPGTEVCSRLRASDSLRALHLVALTGATDSATLERMSAVGFDATLTKPVELDELLDTLSIVASAGNSSV